jgi:hypothetical protein
MLILKLENNQHGLSLSIKNKISFLYVVFSLRLSFKPLTWRCLLSKSRKRPLLKMKTFSTWLSRWWSMKKIRSARRLNQNSTGTTMEISQCPKTIFLASWIKKVSSKWRKPISTRILMKSIEIKTTESWYKLSDTTVLS